MTEMTKRELWFTWALSGAAMVAALVLSYHLSAVVENWVIAGLLASGTLIGSGTSMLMSHFSLRRARRKAEAR